MQFPWYFLPTRRFLPEYHFNFLISKVKLTFMKKQQLDCFFLNRLPVSFFQLLLRQHHHHPGTSLHLPTYIVPSWGLNTLYGINRLGFNYTVMYGMAQRKWAKKDPSHIGSGPSAAQPHDSHCPNWIVFIVHTIVVQFVCSCVAYWCS